MGWTRIPLAPDPAIVTTPRGSNFTLSQGQREALTRKYFSEELATKNQIRTESEGYNPFSHLLAYPLATGVNLVDDLAGNRLTSWLTGVEKGDVWNMVEDYGLGAGEALKDYYKANEGAVDLGSGLTGAVGVGYLTAAKMLPWVSSRLMASSALTGSRLWQSGAAFNAATRSRVLEQNLAAAYTQGVASGWSSAATTLRGIEIGKAAGVAAIEEAAIITTMNANDLIWDPEDIAGSMFWASLGIGIGAGVGALRARRQLRGFSNAPEVIAARAEAQDPLGVTRRAQGNTDSANIALAKPAPGASVTRNALQAYQAPRTVTGALASRLNAAQTGYLDATVQDLAKLGFDKKQQRYFTEKVLKDDPLTFHGLEEIRAKQPQKWVDELGAVIADPKASELKKAVARDTLDRMMLNIDGRWFPLKDSPEMYSFVKGGAIPKPTEIRQISPGLTEEIEVTLSSGAKQKLSLAGGPQNFQALNLKDRLHVVEGIREMLKVLKNQKLQYTLPEPNKATWIQYDAALWHSANGGQVALPKGINSLDELEQASIRMKADEILRNPDSLKSPIDFIKWNLPVPTYMERIGTTTTERFKSVLTAAKDGASVTELRTLRGVLQEIQGYTKKGQGPAPVTGNLFDFNRDTEGTWNNPALATFSSRSVSQQDSILQMVENDLVKDRFATIATVTGSLNDFVSDLGRSIMQNPNFVKASNVHGLASDQITGVKSTLSQAIGETRSPEFRYRDSPTMLAVQQLLEMTQRSSDRYLREVVERSLGKTHEQLIGTPARPSRHLIHQFSSYRRGWDLEDSMIQIDPDRYGFQLAKTPKNEKRLGRPIGDRELLMNPRTEQPVVVDDLGRKYLEGFQALTSELLRNRNRLRQALGLEPIKRIPWYQPPPSTKDKIVGFVLDANNQVVPGRSIIASNQEEYDRLARALEGELERGQRLLTREQISAYKDIFDDAELNWVEPAELVAPGKAAKGGLGTEYLNPNSISDAMLWVKDQVESLGLATQRVMLDDQIRSARLRHDVEVAVGAGTGVGKAKRTVYQEYEAHARGIPLSRLESSISGKAGAALDQLAKVAIDIIWPQTFGLMSRRAGRWLDDITHRMGVPENLASKFVSEAKTFRQLATKLGPYSPYRDFEDYLLQTHGHKPPPEVRSITGSLNTMSSALVLRYAEVAHAAMNMLGLLTNSPAIVRSARAPITNFQVSGQAIPVLDTVRILANSVSDMVSKRSGADWDFMVKNGDASQQVAELNKTFSLLTDRSSFGTHMLGTGSKQGKTGVKGLFKEKGIDGILGVMTDTTENWSRQFSHFVGLRLADIHGIEGMDARHNFAREIANAVIANYSPATRPELYQSPFGSLAGLFTSWARAYNQRLFRWLEDGDFARVAEQYAIQSAMFGVRSTAGFKALEWAISGGVDEEGNEVPTLTDKIYARFGPQAGMAVANGGIAALTGLSLYTRGDVNLRTPSLRPLDHMPALSMLEKVGKAGLDIATGGLDPILMGESFVRNMPNRMLRSVLTTAAMGGDEIDATGRIVSDTQTYTDVFARFVGVRSTRQQNQADLYYANSAVMRDEAARLEPLRLRTRSLIRRKGPSGVGSEEWAGLFDEYTRSGGNPRTFRNWIRSQIKEVGSSRELRQVQQYMNDPTNHLRILRYDMYMEGFK